MAALSDPNRRKKLRKVVPKGSGAPSTESTEPAKELTPEEKMKREEENARLALEKKEREMAEERENLVVEMLGFMETPNGSIEDLVDRSAKNTAIARGFIYTLVRRSWVKAYRVKITYPEEAEVKKKRKHVPCTVFPGTQWTSALELPDWTREQIEIQYPEELNFVGNGHMYRFDQHIQRHLVDEIVFYKDKAFPPALIPFTKTEPPKDNSLENRNKWEVWNRKKLTHQQSESAQYDLIINKLKATDATLMAVYGQLEQTIIQIREMNQAVTDTFSSIPLNELRKMVQNIPDQIKQVAKRLHETNGIIIKDSDLKLTPAFIKSMSAPSVPEAVAKEMNPVEEVEEDERSKKRESRNNRQSFVNFGGLPMETVLPLLQSLKAREKSGADKKASRRFTLW
jgi:hypothetical protein